MAIVYLDVDDEITSAAARIRGSEALEIALVLPAGSRIATSRINFRLLAREATERSRRLAIVTPDAAARALAGAAGLPVFATVLEYEAEVVGPLDELPVARHPSEPGRAPGPGGPPAGGGRARGGAPAGGIDRPPGPAAGPAETMRPGGSRPGANLPAAGRAGRAEPGTAGPGDASRREASAAEPADRRLPAVAAVPVEGAGQAGREGAAGRGAVGASTGFRAGTAPAPARRRRWPLVVAVLVALVVLGGVGAVAGYVLLPTATVTLAISAEAVGPVTFTAVADPYATAVDPASATIPAARVAIPLTATGTFKASGKRVEETPATGTVRWDNCDNSRAYTIPGGTIVRTSSGIAFATQESILVPVAITTGTPPNIAVTCQSRLVDVTAVKPGTDGNVDAGAIRVVPGDYNPNIVRVRNPTPTGGGTHDEFPVVAKKDVDKAFAALVKQLDAQLATGAAAPPGMPAGAVAFPATATRGEPTPSEPLADIVGREVETFDLALTAAGTVVTVDPAPLEELGVDRVTAKVPEGMDLRAGSPRVEVGEGIVNGQAVEFRVTARAEAVPRVTEEQVRAMVRGKTASEAERALAAFGSADVVIWPDWATTVTTIDARLAVAVEGVPPAEATPVPATPPASAAGPTPTAVPSAGSTPAPTAAP